MLMATHNQGKITELSRLLADIPFKLVSLDEVNISEVVEETGETFHDNAILKARVYGELSGILTIADDSGLEVDALDGAPGVISARYGSPEYSDEERVDFLLRNLKGVPFDERTARFISVIAIAAPSGRIMTVEGVVEGVIQYEPMGNNGFGYDPVFYVPEYGCTTAQLSLTDKNVISHRGKAVRKAIEVLKTKFMDG